PNPKPQTPKIKQMVQTDLNIQLIIPQMNVFIFVLIWASSYLSQLTCATDFLNAYNIDSSSNPQFQPMILCSGVQMSCCSAFDEMKFHKFWYNYYEQKLNITHRLMLKKHKGMSELLKFFTTFDLNAYKDLLPAGSIPKIESVVTGIQLLKSKVDVELRPIENQFEEITAFDLAEKQNLLCLFCDARNQEYLKASSLNRLLIQQDYCSNIIFKYKRLLNLMAKILHPIYLGAHRIISLFDFPIYSKNQTTIPLIRAVRESIEQTNKCFPKENDPFELKNCQKLCNQYKITGFSKSFFGNYDFYEYLKNKFNLFRKMLKYLKNNKIDKRESPKFQDFVNFFTNEKLYDKTRSRKL
ncbi:MAG: hypothetical protein IT190_08115, partial [Microbacteriaceae bacterium]|nr:hypothetical protein [Microbacteriaceae bacterium]